MKDIKKSGTKYRKRVFKQLCKAPQAPKRFRSSYICFFLSRRKEVKESLGKGANATDLSRAISKAWRNLPDDERAYWKGVSLKEQKQYKIEEAAYSGPWQVKKKRVKKDPRAPKRPMSAFLFFAKLMRPLAKRQHPQMKHPDILCILGKWWRNSSNLERLPFIQLEALRREEYKDEMAKWKEQQNASQETDPQVNETETVLQESPNTPISSDQSEEGRQDLLQIEPIPWNQEKYINDFEWDSCSESILESLQNLTSPSYRLPYQLTPVKTYSKTDSFLAQGIKSQMPPSVWPCLVTTSL